MTLLKNSPDKEEIKDRYDQLWTRFLELEDEKVEKILEKAEYELMPTKGKLAYSLRPFKTHLIWIIPVSIISLFLILYFLFLWVSLLVE